MSQAAQVKCPTCKKKGEWFDDAYGPFCSRRCKLIDLGKWPGEEHVISDPLRPEHLEKYAELPPGEYLNRIDELELQGSTQRPRPTNDMLQRKMNRAVYLLLALGALTLRAAEPAKIMTTTNKTELATLGGGCFWCLEATFELLPGVKAVVNGYAGGHKENPTYEEVCAKATGHAEVVQIEFDPQVISYEKLLETFWEVHDPTTLNRQGNDSGPQYRSVIFHHNDAQKELAVRSVAAAQQHWPDKIVTEIAPLKKFYRAEEGHQDYFRKHPEAGYCQVVIRPKVNKIEKKLKAAKH